MARSTSERTQYDIDMEVAGAREKFPKNEDLIEALGEEFGELCQALLKRKHEKGTDQQVYTEAVQVAAVAIRIIEEGVAGYPYKWDYELYKNFVPTGRKTAAAK